MELAYLPLGPVQANCFIVKENGHALIVDPGDVFDFSDVLKDTILDGILLTHCHFDHIGGVDALVETYGCPVYIHASEKDYLKNPTLNGSVSFGMQVIQNTSPIPIQEGMLKVGNFDLQVMHTPGHSKGSCVYVLENVMFTGDFLFSGSIGRTDLYGGSFSVMQKSLEQFKQVEGEYTIFPGHGSYSTLSHEKKYNPYL